MHIIMVHSENVCIVMWAVCNWLYRVSNVHIHYSICMAVIAYQL